MNISGAYEIEMYRWQLLKICLKVIFHVKSAAARHTRIYSGVMVIKYIRNTLSQMIWHLLRRK